MMTVPTICSAHWRIWTRIKISSPRQICSPSGRFGQSVLSPAWIPPVKHWQCPSGSMARLICLIWQNCWVHPASTGASPQSCPVRFSRTLPPTLPTPKRAGRWQTSTCPAMSGQSCGWHSLLRKITRSSRLMWTH